MNTFILAVLLDMPLMPEMVLYRGELPGRVVRLAKQKETMGSSTGRVRALERGLTILEILGQTPDISLTEISEKADLPLSTAYRMVETLVERGFVVYSKRDGRYRIGLKAFEIGSSYVKSNSLQEIAAVRMKQLVQEVNETANLAVLDRSEAVYVFQVEGRRTIRMFTSIGARVPLYCSGVGKALLAWLPNEEVERILANVEFVRHTPATLTNMEVIQQEFAKIRKAGYAFDLEEYEANVRCVAAPVRDQHGTVIAAVSVSAPKQRFTDELLNKIAKRAVVTANDISRQLGWSTRNQISEEFASV